MQHLQRYLHIGFGLAISLLCLSGPATAQTPTPTRTPPTSSLRAQGIIARTDEWIIQAAPGADVATLARQLGVRRVRPAQLPGFFVVQLPNTRALSATGAQTQATQLRTAPAIVSAEQNVILNFEKRFIPADPLYPDQWHLNNTGQTGGPAGQDINAEGAWDLPNWPGGGFSGSGVIIGVADDGLQFAHPDLSRYAENRSYDYRDGDPDPSPDSTNDAHGTAAGGIAAARANGVCGVGVGFGATVAGQRFNVTSAGVVNSGDVIGNNSAVVSELDVSNNSWGPRDDAKTAPNMPVYVMSNFENRIENGRNGLGWVYVWANGNGGNQGDWAGADLWASSRYTIAVSATDNNGNRLNYSEGGSNIIVNAPADVGNGEAITTTDLLGGLGYEPGDCTNDFNGTSASAPIVTGTVALMLEANPQLTWRDVQHILINTAEQNDPGDQSWFTNGAGYNVSEFYGFGRVNAAKATTTAALWNSLPDEISATSGVQAVNAVLPSNNALSRSYTFNNPGITSLEHVEVTINATTNYRGDLELSLVSPDGTLSTLMKSRSSDSATTGWNDWTFTSNAFWGENPQGAWTVLAQDTFSGVAPVTLEDFEITLYGTAAQPTFTDLALTQADSQDPVTEQTFARTLTVTNTSQTAAQNIQAELTLPTALAYDQQLTVSDGGTCVSAAQTLVRCNWPGPLGAGQAFTASLQLRVSPAPSQREVISSATVTTNPQNDLDTLNNAYIQESTLLRFFSNADVNDDGLVTPADVAFVINRVGTADTDADVNGDGVINNQDVALVIDSLGESLTD